MFGISAHASLFDEGYVYEDLLELLDKFRIKLAMEQQKLGKFLAVDQVALDLQGLVRDLGHAVLGVPVNRCGDPQQEIGGEFTEFRLSGCFECQDVY